jgi:hypothetical protein
LKYSYGWDVFIIGDFKVEPGGNLNITCSAVAYPFPEIVWQREEEAINWPGQAAPGASIRSEQLLIIKEVWPNNIIILSNL